ncbi:hypothetical protein CVT25_006850 [Psilocybe cyanescens]|uniref:Uncharacterized protein n=1 Tax=Psilocybe cyanescens TaxID=93625 RepID=A0A409X7C9_PSICY|nr:hypothetical protein CVT25_006850 [Psilocybe cyanescens]
MAAVYRLGLHLVLSQISFGDAGMGFFRKISGYTFMASTLRKSADLLPTVHKDDVPDVCIHILNLQAEKVLLISTLELRAAVDVLICIALGLL